jgi:hypothetical protein
MRLLGDDDGNNHVDWYGFKTNAVESLMQPTNFNPHLRSEGQRPSVSQDAARHAAP